MIIEDSYIKLGYLVTTCKDRPLCYQLLDALINMLKVNSI